MRSASSIGSRPRRDRAADRAGLDPPALDPHEHFGRGGDQKLAVAEIDQRAIRRRVGVAQPLEDDARQIGAAIGEKLARNHLEQIAADEGLLGAFDERGVFAGAVVAFGRRRAPARGRGDRAPSRVARGSPAVELPREFELIAMSRRDLAHMVDDQDLVRQVQHQVALVGRPRQAQRHRFELKHQIVAERAVEPEMLVLGAVRTGRSARAAPKIPRAGGCAAPRESARAVSAISPSNAARCRSSSRPIAGKLESAPTTAGISTRPRRLSASIVKSRPRAVSSQRRIDKSHVPARVAAGKFEARRKQHAAPVIERPASAIIGRLIGLFAKSRVLPRCRQRWRNG